MDVEKLTRSLSDHELLRLRDLLPAELQKRGDYMGSLAVDGSISSEVSGVYENLTRQLFHAYCGYGSTTGFLNEKRKRSKQLAQAPQETLASEFREWVTEEKLVYVARAQEADPALRFTLVATPNVQVGGDEVANLTDFAYKELFTQYTPEQLAGYNPNNGIFNFSLMPTKLDEALIGPVEFQTTQLARMQEAHSFLRVPRPLEAFTHAKTLEAQSGELTGADTHGRVYIKSFDLPPKSIGDWLYVPAFDVFDDGGYHFGRLNVDRANYARVAVG